MDDRDMPDLGPYAFEQLEQELHEIDLRYWRELQGMQVSTVGMVALATFLKAGMSPPPRPFKLPQHLLVILRRYAESLFYAEASKYPPISPQFLHWLSNLAERCGARVIQNVKNLEAGSLGITLAYHGVTESEMQETVDGAGLVMVAKFTGDRQPQQVVVRSEQKVSPTTKKRRLGAMVTAPKAARKLEDYLAANGIGLTEFATQAQTTDRTLRNFRKTGKVRRDIFDNIARAMGTTKDALLKS